MKLIYIKSTMEPKNYSTIRSILKKAQGEKIAPYIFKINNTQTLQDYLDQEKITYEIYQEERKIRTHKRALTPAHGELRKKKKTGRINNQIIINHPLHPHPLLLVQQGSFIIEPEVFFFKLLNQYLLLSKVIPVQIKWPGDSFKFRILLVDYPQSAFHTSSWHDFVHLTFPYSI